MSHSELFGLKGQKQAGRARKHGQRQEPAVLTAPEDLPGGTLSLEDAASMHHSAKTETSKRDKSPSTKERLVPKLLAPTAKPISEQTPGFFETLFSGRTSGSGFGGGMVGVSVGGGGGGGDCGDGGGDCGC